MKTNITPVIRLGLAALCCGLGACATTTVERLDDATIYHSGACSVTVYPTETMAQEAGTFQEVCIVTGSSAFSFDHSISGAINKNVSKVCECGADSAYIQSRSTESSLGMRGVSNVTLVGIRYDSR